MENKTIASLVVIVAVIVAVILVGFYEGKLPFTEEYKERELVKQWFLMYGKEIPEDDLEGFMEELETRNIHPVEIYRGSMIFYERSYGYIYIPELDEDFKGYPRHMPDTKIFDLVKEKGGTNTIIYIFGDAMGFWCLCFPTLGEAENFLAELWSSTQSTPTPQIYKTPTPTPTPELNEERELMKQWMQMYGEYDPELDEDDLDAWLNEFHRYNIHPVEIYRGSMIFHEKSYGYIYIPDIDDDFREWPHDMTEKKFIDLAKENGGETTIIHVFEQDTMCACFPTLSSAENFLAEFWSIS